MRSAPQRGGIGRDTGAQLPDPGGTDDSNTKYDGNTLRLARSRGDDCQAGLQSLDGAAGSARHSSLYRHDLRVFRVPPAVVSRDRYHEGCRLSGGHDRLGPALHHDLRLAGGGSRLDLLDRHRHARRIGGRVRRLARKERAAQGRCHCRTVLGWWLSDFGLWHPRPSALDAVARLGRHRRHRSRPWLYLPRLDADQMVPGSARHGDGHGDHGLRRWCADRCAACQQSHHAFRQPDQCRRHGDVRRHGRRLFRLHDGWRAWLSRPAEWLAARGLDAAGSRRTRHDHHARR